MVRKLHRVEHYLAAIPEIEKASTQLKLLGQVRQALPQELRYQCLGATLDNGRLILFVPSSAWAGRLRFYFVVVQTELARSEVVVDRMDVRIIPPRKVLRDVAHPREISSASASLLRHTAKCVDDPDLAAALSRLAAHGCTEKN